MKQLLKIIIILIFSFVFIACEKPAQKSVEESAEQSAKELSQEEIGKKLTEAIQNKNWQEVDNVLDSISEEEKLPEILQIIDTGNLEKFRVKIKQVDEYIHIRTAEDDCLGVKVDLSITPLGYAVQKNKIEIVRYLLSRETNIEKGTYNKVVGQGWVEIKSPLFIAVSNKNKNIAKLLISRWADVDFIYDGFDGDCESSNSSVLIEAVKWGDKYIINALLAKGVDINKLVLQGDSKVSALDFAKDKEIRQILISHGAKSAKDLKINSKIDVYRKEAV